MSIACSDCGAVEALTYVTTDTDTFDNGPRDGERCRVGVYLCRACFDDRYPLGTFGAEPAGHDPDDREWLPDDVRNAIGALPD